MHMLGNLRSNLLTGTVLGATLICSAQASAQSTSSAEAASAPGDIIVTARRVEERLQDVPISITVLSQDQITERNIVSAGDLATYTPSLSSNSFFGSANTNFSIRGFVQEFQTQPSVGVYFADVVSPRGGTASIPVGDGAGPGSFFDLQNVQVLKGPQGTLFGRNTTGGAVLLVPQKPTGRFEGYVEGAIGNYDMRRIQAVLNVPLDDTVRFRVGVDRQTRDGYVRNTSGVGPDQFNDIDYVAIRASLVADLTPDLENYLLVSYMSSQTAGSAMSLFTCNPSPVGAGAVLGATLACAQLQAARNRGDGFYTVQNNYADAHSDLRTWQIIDTTTYRATDTLTVKNIISYAQLKQDLFSPIFGTFFDPRALSPLLPAGLSIGLTGSRPTPGLHTANQSTFSEELQFQFGSAGGRFNGQVGAYLEMSDPLGRTGAIAANFVDCPAYPSLACTNPIGAGGTSSQSIRIAYRNVGIYAQGTYALTDQFKVTGGIRYTWDKVKADSILRAYTYGRTFAPALPIGTGCSSNLTPPDCSAQYGQTTEAPTWLIDVDYKPIEDILLYAKYARGYRAGGISPQAPVQFSKFDAEKVDAYELGLKSSFHGAVSGTFNVAAFYNDFSNQQLLTSFVPVVTGLARVSGIRNAGKSRMYGLEVDASINLFEGFRLDASYTYLNAKLQSVPTPVAPPNYTFQASQTAGDPIPFSPKNKYTITGTYTLPLDESIGRISVGATFAHTDRNVANLARGATGLLPTSYLQARNLLNLNASWNSIAGSPVDVALFATNVTKQKYYTGLAGLFVSGGFETAQLGEPRMYGMRVRVNLGR